MSLDPRSIFAHEHRISRLLDDGGENAGAPDAAAHAHERRATGSRASTPALGSQILLDLYGCDRAVLDDEAEIEKTMLEAAAAARATVVHHRFHKFSPQGVSGVVVIAESHLAIHTWPERGYAAIDLFTCGSTLDAEACFAALKSRLRCERMGVAKVPRGLLSAVDPDAPEARPARLHDALYRYDDEFVARFVHASAARPDRGAARDGVREIADQVYQLRLFTPELCSLLIEEHEHHGRWMIQTAGSPIDPGVALSWAELPGLADVFDLVIRRHVQPIIEALWPTFDLAHWHAPRVYRQEPHSARPADLQHDAAKVGMIGPPSDGFEVGGTPLPRWNLTLGRPGEADVGSAVVSPSGASHDHLALHVKLGRRHVLAISLHGAWRGARPTSQAK